jgi:hypothetical protein
MSHKRNNQNVLQRGNFRCTKKSFLKKRVSIFKAKKLLGITFPGKRPEAGTRTTCEKKNFHKELREIKPPGEIVLEPPFPVEEKTFFIFSQIFFPSQEIPPRKFPNP